MIDPQNPQFLSAEESALVDGALLSNPEKFLTRLTLSSWRLLLLIAQTEGIAIEDLSPAQIIAWFEQDAKKRRDGEEGAILKW